MQQQQQQPADVSPRQPPAKAHPAAAGTADMYSLLQQLELKMQEASRMLDTKTQQISCQMDSKVRDTMQRMDEALHARSQVQGMFQAALEQLQVNGQAPQMQRGQQHLSHHAQQQQQQQQQQRCPRNDQQESLQLSQGAKQQHVDAIARVASTELAAGAGEQMHQLNSEAASFLEQLRSEVQEAQKVSDRCTESERQGKEREKEAMKLELKRLTTIVDELVLSDRHKHERLKELGLLCATLQGTVESLRKTTLDTVLSLMDPPSKAGLGGPYALQKDVIELHEGLNKLDNQISTLLRARFGSPSMSGHQSIPQAGLLSAEPLSPAQISDRSQHSYTGSSFRTSSRASILDNSYPMPPSPKTHLQPTQTAGQDLPHPAAPTPQLYSFAPFLCPTLPPHPPSPLVSAGPLLRRVSQAGVQTEVAAKGRTSHSGERSVLLSPKQSMLVDRQTGPRGHEYSGAEVEGMHSMPNIEAVHHEEAPMTVSQLAKLKSSPGSLRLIKPGAPAHEGPRSGLRRRTTDSGSDEVNGGRQRVQIQDSQPLKPRKSDVTDEGAVLGVKSKPGSMLGGSAWMSAHKELKDLR